MKKVSLDTRIQLLGMLGVLVGLAFVSFEMRQSHNIASATQVQASLEQQLDRNRTWFERQWGLGYALATTPYTNSLLQRDRLGIKI